MFFLIHEMLLLYTFFADYVLLLMLYLLDG